MEPLTKEGLDKIIKESKNRVQAISELKNYVDGHCEQKAILGIDIYRYSQFPFIEQSLIPYLFKILYKQTIDNCQKMEKYIFQFYLRDEAFIDFFIDTGDGGFQIFDTPFHATLFAIYFQANVNRYNSGKHEHTNHLNEIIGNITVRYSLTYNKTFKYEGKFYGPSIITNARIIAKDKLDRFLIDDATFKWYSNVFNGIENLQSIALSDFLNIKLFTKYKFNGSEKMSTIFTNDGSCIINLDVLKIGDTKSKMDILSIYSLHIQTLLTSKGLLNEAFDKFTISLGNLNTSGITE